MIHENRWLRTCGPRIVALMAITGLASPTFGADSPVSPRSATVYLAVQSSAPDYLYPWQRAQAEQASGSGVIIEGNRILTNAHVVVHAAMIEVKREGMARRVPGKVTQICQSCDLALVEVDTPGFFDGVTPLPLGDLPELQDEVQVHGYPVGGEAISVTSGVVSRIEVGMYAHSMDDLLLVQIDASINNGNSGGPVTADGKLVGIASQSLDDAENVGYIIPVPIIQHFLDDVKDGRFDGFPRPGLEYQGVENEALRRVLKLPADLTGALIDRLDHGSPSSEVLQPGDVILAIDGTPISEDLNVTLAGGARVDFLHLIRSRQVGDSIPLDIWRDGKRQTVTMVMKPWDLLVPDQMHPDSPPYLIFGGLVFQPLRSDYLVSLEEPPSNLVVHYLYDNLTTAEHSELVIVSSVLKHEVNKGYEWVEDSVVTQVNGETIRDFQHLVDLLESASGPIIEIRNESEGRIVLDVEKARESTEFILRSYGISSDRSQGLQASADKPQSR